MSEPTFSEWVFQRQELSVLEPGLDRSARLGMVLAVLLMLIAVVFWVVPTRRVRADD